MTDRRHPRSFVASRNGREALFLTFENCVHPGLAPEGYRFERTATGFENPCPKCPRIHKPGPCPTGDEDPIASAGGVYE